MRRIRGREIAMIFQEPMTSLNPLFTIGDQIIEMIQLHEPVSNAEARKRARRMLEVVEIPAAERRLDEYPHQMSGGMRQRAMIALALSCNPNLLIADEPTTALDVTIQAQILDLLRRLQAEIGMSILFVTHNLGLWPKSPTKWSSCTRGGLWNTRRLAISSIGRDIPIRRDCSPAFPTRRAIVARPENVCGLTQFRETSPMC